MIPTIAVANHKGGVGKTTTVHALGVTLARDRGQRVVMVDMDPQSSLSESCMPGVTPRVSMVHVLAERKAPPITEALAKLQDRLWLAPATLELARTQRDLASRLVGRDTALKRALGRLEDVDIVLIDCPPSLDVLTLNGLLAATHVLIPTKPQVVDLRGLRLFLETLDDMHPANEGLALLGILLTFWEGFNLHRRALEVLRADGLPVLSTRIGKSVRVAESPERGLSVLETSPDNPRAAEYRALGEELLCRIAA